LEISTLLNGAVRSSDVAQFKYFRRAPTNQNLTHEETESRSNWV